MLVARCHIPRCEDTAGRRGFMCPTHWALVPKTLQLRYQAAYRAWSGRSRASTPPGYAKPWETGAECIRIVLFLLWSHAFPVPPECQSRLFGACPCPLCSQARAVAPPAFAARRYTDTRALNDARPQAQAAED
jgi:hypothetical protein